MKKRFLFLSLFLTSCSSVFSERVVCPKAVILAEFSKSVAFHQGVPTRTEMDSLVPYCTAEDNHIFLDMKLRMTSLRPFSKVDSPLTIKPSYFIAVIDEKGTILSRTNHDMEVTFEEKQTTKVSFEQIQEKVSSLKEVSLYIGFNLDEDQINYLEKERTKKTPMPASDGI